MRRVSGYQYSYRGGEVLGRDQKAPTVTVEQPAIVSSERCKVVDLGRHLMGLGRQAELHEHVAEVTSDNGAMLKVFEKSGPKISTEPEGPIRPPFNSRSAERSASALQCPAFKPSLSPAILTLMNERIRKLTEQASLLPPVERAELVEGILQSLDATDPNLDQLWAEEAQDRLAAYRRGELEALDFDETLAKYASR